VLHAESVGGLGPHFENDNSIEDGRQSECKVPSLEPFRAEGKEQRAGDGREEDIE
jgi:hypothetical protein